MYTHKKILWIFSLFALFLFSGCETPTLGKKVVKEYYTGGQLLSEFIWSDSKGQSGTKRTYGYEGHLTSSVHIRNGVEHGIKSYYDKDGHIIKQTPYVNGRIDGIEKAFYPNGDKMVTYPYINGIKNGYAFSYYPNGKVCRKVKYVNNRIVN